MFELVCLLAAWFAWRMFLAAVWPETSCKTDKCKGGKIYSPDGESWRRHGKCEGTGRAPRNPFW